MDASKLKKDLEDEAADLDVLNSPVSRAETQATEETVVIRLEGGRSVTVHGAHPALAAKLREQRSRQSSSGETDAPL